MKIGELAQLANCGTETIRYYEKIGLLPPPRRDHSNYRQYHTQHLERLRFIRNCRSLDMTHDEIRDLLAFMDAPQAACHPVTEIITEHLRHVDVRIQELQQLRQQLQQLQHACAHEGTTDDCGILEQISNMTPLPENETHLG
ncbi:MAG: Cd(II)/Pb(II)-responsive transcriptional regulator [Alcaligenaceae bacterium]|nr:Cd(II)/Pb(II)-responsive transcriptional regulator [Alcaligenaceae bacterium]